MTSEPLPGLAANLEFTVHTAGDKIWYAVNEPNSGRFVRLGTREYSIAAELDGCRSAEDIEKVLAAEQPELEVRASEVSELVNWLRRVAMTSDTQPKVQSRPTSSRPVLSLLYMRFPIFAGHHIEKLSRHFLWIMHPAFCCVCVLLMAIAALQVGTQWTDFCNTASHLFVADGRLWWIVAWIVLKGIHELGHAVVAVKFGAKIRSAGISLIFLAPVPYIDISDLWTLPNRWQRILCSSGGMLLELTLASLAAIVALSTSSESLQYFCAAIATLGTFTTLAFNANPLMRFDGYFILSDLLNRANFWTDAQAAVKLAVNRMLHFKFPIQGDKKVYFGLQLLYGLACTTYRLLMMLTLGIWAVIVWKGVGVLLVLWVAYGLFVSPIVASFRKSNGQAIDLRQILTQFATGCLAILLLTIIVAVPAAVPASAPGVVDFREPISLHFESEGVLRQVHLPASGRVEAGKTIAIFENPLLEKQIRLKLNQIEQVRERIRAMRDRREIAASLAESQQLDALFKELEVLRGKESALTVNAPESGQLYSQRLVREIGKHFIEGASLGLLSTQEQVEVRGSVSQEDAEALRPLIGSRVKVCNELGVGFTGVLESIEPRGSKALEDEHLAAIYGGPLSIELNQNTEQREKLQLLQPRFGMVIRVSSQSSYSLVPGQRVWIDLPSRRTLWASVWGWLQKQIESIEQQS